MRDCVVTIVLILCMLCCGAAAAQTAGLEDLRVLDLEELMNAEVISSTQQYVRLQEAPSTMYVITGDQIRKWGIRRLSELVERVVPGASTAEDFDDLILSFRGVAADNNLKVLLLWNGHDYNTQWNNGPSSEVELGMMEDIKKVEVLIGPHSALYGSGALLAVINIIPRTGRDFSGVRVSGSYGTGDYKKGELMAGGRLNGDLDYFFSAGGLSADGYENNDNRPLNISRFPPGYRFYGNVSYKEFQLMSRFTRSSRAFYVQPARNTKPNTWTNYDTFFVDARRDFQLSDEFRGVLNFNYDTVQTQRHDFTLGTKLRAVGEDRFSARFTGFYSGWDNHNLVLGTLYRRDEFGDDWYGDNFNISTEIVDGVVTGIPADPYTRRTLTPYGRNAYALFGQDSMRLGERTTLLLGFRYDRIEAPQIRKPDSFSPRVALVIKAGANTVLKAMFTSGLSRQPNAAVVSPDSFAFGAPVHTDFTRPEKMNSFELSASHQPRSNIDLQFNFYYNSLQDLFGLDPQSLKPNTVPVLITAGRVDYVGFEAVANVNFGKFAFLRAGHQHVDLGSTVNDVLKILTTPDGSHPLNFPEDVTKLVLDVRLNQNVSVNANSVLTWNNHGIDVAGKTADTGFYSQLNANLVWNIRPHLQIIFSGNNLLDTQQRVPPLALRAYTAERNFNLNCGYRF